MNGKNQDTEDHKAGSRAQQPPNGGKSCPDSGTVLAIAVVHLQPSLTSVCPPGWAQVKQLPSDYTREKPKRDPEVHLRDGGTGVITSKAKNKGEKENFLKGIQGGVVKVPSAGREQGKEKRTPLRPFRRQTNTFPSFQVA